MVTFTYQNDTVDDMCIGDGGGDGGGFPARTTNSPGSSLANANKRSTFSFCALVDLGKIAREWGGVHGRETLKARDRFSYYPRIRRFYCGIIHAVYDRHPPIDSKAARAQSELGGAPIDRGKAEPTPARGS
jgi:hypothetical protein